MNLQIQYHYHTPRSMGAQRYIVAHNGVLCFNNSIGEQLNKVTDHGSMFMIIDGMSGLQNDRLAVELAVQMFTKLYMFNAPHFDIEHLRMFVGKSHLELRTCMNERHLPLMGCSLSLIWIHNGHAMWISLGNTSIYIQQQSILERLSHPHTVEEFVNREWLDIEPTNALAQGWLLGSKIPGQAHNIFLQKDLDFGCIELHSGQRFLILNHALHQSCSTQYLQSIIQSSTLQKTLSSTEEEERCVITIAVE